VISVDWDSKESHIKFAQSPAYEPFKENLSVLMTAVHFHHVAFSPFPPKIVTRAPVIEFATFLDTKPHFLSNIEKFMKGIGTPDECYGSAWGDSVETDVGKHSDGSVKGKATVLLIGWESKEAHMRFRETDVFEKNIGLLREGMGGVEMVSLGWMGVPDVEIVKLLILRLVSRPFHSRIDRMGIEMYDKMTPSFIHIHTITSWWLRPISRIHCCCHIIFKICTSPWKSEEQLDLETKHLFNTYAIHANLLQNRKI